ETAVGAENQIPIRVDLHCADVDVRRSKTPAGDVRNLAAQWFRGVNAGQIVGRSPTVSHVGDIRIGRVRRDGAEQTAEVPAAWHIKGHEASAICRPEYVAQDV